MVVYFQQAQAVQSQLALLAFSKIPLALKQVDELGEQLQLTTISVLV